MKHRYVTHVYLNFDMFLRYVVSYRHIMIFCWTLVSAYKHGTQQRVTIL